MKKAKIFYVALVIMLVMGAAYLLFLQKTNIAPVSVQQGTTTGQAVNDVPLSWVATTSAEYGITFRYPKKLELTYVDTIDWPPSIQVVDEPFACTQGGAIGARAGKTEQRTIGDTTYCVTEVTEGAAGSIYTMYSYAFAHDTKTMILHFTLRFPQCANYPQKRNPNVKANVKHLVLTNSWP